jgi:hypothetical protein
MHSGSGITSSAMLLAKIVVTEAIGWAKKKGPPKRASSLK